MMMNLFSIFDPSIYSFYWSWLSFFSILILFFSSFFYFNSHSSIMKSTILKSLFSEHIVLLKNSSPMNIILTISLFIIILVNTISLSLFNFTPTVHLVVVLPLALVIWLSIILWGLMTFFTEVLSHLVPIGTPFILLSFMVLIELISNIIRPVTLSIRLISNMLAGHLMMELISLSLIMISPMKFLLILPILLILSILELSVSIIQAYVFSTLITLYLSETI